MSNISIATRPNKPPKSPTYRTKEEVVAVERFDEHRYFHQDEYRVTIANYYNPNEEEFECRLIRAGVHCNRSHKWGYIVELTDGSRTNVGNTCIFKNLDTSEAIKEGTRKFLREKQHKERLEDIGKQFGERRNRIEYMEFYLEQLLEVQDYLDAFRDCFGNSLYKDLVDRAKADRLNISAIGIIRRRYWDEDQRRERTETRKIPHTIDTLRGLDIFSGRGAALRNRIRGTVEFYRDFTLDMVPEETPDQHITDIRKRLEEYYPYEREVDSLTHSLEQFKSNNLRCLSCWSDAKADRIHALQAHHAWIGKPISREKAKDQLKEFDDQLSAHLGADYVQYRSI